jgi:hypothetical protein
MLVFLRQPLRFCGLRSGDLIVASSLGNEEERDNKVPPPYFTSVRRYNIKQARNAVPPSRHPHGPSVVNRSRKFLEVAELLLSYQPGKGRVLSLRSGR